MHKYWLLRQGRPMVGQEAQDQAAANPENTFSSVKVLMGSTLEPGKVRLTAGGRHCRGNEDGMLALHCPAM